MTQVERARAFSELHTKGDPVVLYNIWDAGSARALANAGAAALATGSWSVAAAQGFDDGEQIPLDLVETIVARIVATVDVPLSVDFEGGYAVDSEGVLANAARIFEAGAVGVNFEDQIIGGDGLHAVEDHSRRIAAVRRAAEQTGVPAFINARTDLFLQEGDRSKHAALLPAAIERAARYRDAGASGFFVPGLVTPKLIAGVCDRVSLPLNIMMAAGAPPIAALAELGVARVSFGPGPHRQSMSALAEAFAKSC